MLNPSSLTHYPPFPILPLLKSCKTIRSLNQVHTHIVRRGLDQDHFLIAHFISLCAAFAPTRLSYPISVFESVSAPNIYLWNIMMRALCQSSTLDDGFLFFNRMRRGVGSVGPDKYTFPSLIKMCANGLAVRGGRAVHGAVVRCGSEGDVFVGSSLVDFYGKCGEIGCARKVFDGMSVRNEVSWTAMVAGYLSVGDLAAARGVFDEMPVRNEVSWNVLIKGFVRVGDLKGAREVFEAMPEKNEVSFTILIDGYAKSGDMAAARALFDELGRKDLVSWSALVSGYVQNGRPNEALKVFDEMCDLGVKPDEFVMVSLMAACSQLGSLELAKWIETYMAECCFDLGRPHVTAALVDMYAKCGNMERATFLFEKMPKRDLISYCSMIQGLCNHGLGVEAVLMFDRMLNEGIRPDEVAFTVILTSCGRAGRVDDGCRYFDLMIHKFSICPSPDHYACMVNLLGKSGRLRAAYELIQSKPVESHAGTWGALLEACRLHSDIDLGKEIACKLFELEPLNAGNYVLLSNIYADVGRWLDVLHLRGKMSERGVRKVPGCSYVETT